MDSRYSTIGGERCQNCGRIYKTCWKAPDPTWLRLVGDYDGLLCIDCFDSIAAANRISLAWECKPHPVFKENKTDG